MSTVNRGEALLYALKSRGPQSAATLAQACGLSTMGAHKQLQALQAQGLVDFSEQRQGVGRPARLWALSAAGHGRFPDRHGELAVQLIRQMGQLMGEAGLERLISAREREQAALHAQRLAGLDGLDARVQALAALRAEEGYLARAEPGPEPGVWWLIEDHCPICAAAQSCQGFCRSELALFRQILGPEVRVERREHLLAGARRCAYRIEAAPPPAPGSSSPN